jgi:hypothetical protein
LGAALEAELSEVVVIGWRGDGGLWISGSEASGPAIVWLLEKAKQFILDEA